MAQKGTKKENKKTEFENWNSGLKGKCRVFCNEFTYKKDGKKKSSKMYSSSISRKNEDDEYENFYFNLAFKKDEEPDVEDGENVIIMINDGFLSNFTNKDGSVKLKLVVTDWEEFKSDEDDEEPEEDEKPKKKQQRNN